MKSIRTTCKTSQQYKVKKKSCKYSQEAQYFEGKKKWAMDRWLVPSLALGPPCHNLRESPKLPLMPQRSGFKICPYKPLSLHYCKTQMSPPETRSIYTNLVLFFSWIEFLKQRCKAVSGHWEVLLWGSGMSSICTLVACGAARSN